MIIREGRFDRRFKVDIHDEESIKTIISKLLEDHNFEIINDKEGVEELILHLKYDSISKIKSILNSVYLRYGKNAILDDFIKEKYHSVTGIYKRITNYMVPEYIAVHEAGHALYLYKFSKSKKLLRVICDSQIGITYSTNNSRYSNRESEVESLQIALAGFIAEELILKKHDIGSALDLEKAFKIVFKLMN